MARETRENMYIMMALILYKREQKNINKYGSARGLRISGVFLDVLR
jgi:hypothetical protein